MSRQVPGPPCAPAFGVVVPVKAPGLAKSRLAPLGDQARVALAEAFAADTVSAVLGCGQVARVVVVTDDDGVASALRAQGADVVPDGCGGDLNQALVRGAAELVRSRPGLRPVAVCADLPALRSGELARALGRMPARRAGFVPDVSGEGTTVLAAPSYAELAPRFGPRSRTAHVAAGALEVEAADVPTVRRDVDTPADLREAVALGVGPRTASVLRGLAEAYPVTVQATVATYDPQTRSGTVLLDDGHVLPFAASALEGTGLRLLRLGQRVRLETSGAVSALRVERLQILTLE